MFPIPKMNDPARVRNFRDLIESGKFKPVIDRTYPLDQIAEAYRYIEKGRKSACHHLRRAFELGESGNILADAVEIGDLPALVG